MNGFMLQVVELDRGGEHKLGSGQEIEVLMAGVMTLMLLSEILKVINFSFILCDNT